MTHNTLHKLAILNQLSLSSITKLCFGTSSDNDTTMIISSRRFVVSCRGINTRLLLSDGFPRNSIDSSIDFHSQAVGKESKTRSVASKSEQIAFFCFHWLSVDRCQRCLDIVFVMAIVVMMMMMVVMVVMVVVVLMMKCQWLFLCWQQIDEWSQIIKNQFNIAFIIASNAIKTSNFANDIFVASAIKVGSQMLEMDCHMTSDGEVVVVHDFNLSNLCQHPVAVSATAFKDLPLYKERVSIAFAKGEMRARERERGVNAWRCDSKFSRVL